MKWHFHSENWSSNIISTPLLCFTLMVIFCFTSFVALKLGFQSSAFVDGMIIKFIDTWLPGCPMCLYVTNLTYNYDERITLPYCRIWQNTMQPFKVLFLMAPRPSLNFFFLHLSASPTSYFQFIHKVPTVINLIEIYYY